MKKSTLIITTLLFIFSGAQAQDNHTTTGPVLKPDFIELQFAGSSGLFTAGAGYKIIHQKVDFSLMYGYVPPSLGGKSIHTLALKNSIIIDRTIISRHLSIYPLLGFSTHLDLSGIGKFKFGNRYPDGYYAPNAIHWRLFWGGRVAWDHTAHSCISTSSLAIEIGTMETYLWYGIKSKEIPFYKIWNIALAYKVYLK